MNIERLKGSPYDDVLEGDANVNTLAGEDGCDMLIGIEFNDLCKGGLPNAPSQTECDQCSDCQDAVGFDVF